MVVNGHDIQLHLDSGAIVNVLPAREYMKAVCGDPDLKGAEDLRSDFSAR